MKDWRKETLMQRIGTGAKRTFQFRHIKRLGITKAGNGRLRLLLAESEGSICKGVYLSCLSVKGKMQCARRGL